MQRLVLQGGEVVGAMLGGREVRAAKGVVLATGGFTSSPDWRNRLLPEWVSHALSAPGATGDGLVAAIEPGGRISSDHAAPSFYMPASPIGRVGKTEVLFPHVIADRARPGVIAVDGTGQRFVNEGNSYHDFVEAMLARGQRVAYLICDRPSLRKYGLGVIRPVWQWLPYYIRKSYIETAPTLADLAAKLRIDPAALDRTVSRYNKFCASGRDGDFGKGSNSLNLMYGDRSVTPNPCLGPIATPPFLAIPVIPAAIGASVGLETDADARVLGRTGKPIKGLFACGNDMASVMRGRYAGAGITLGPAITFAYRAAMKASAKMSVDHDSK
jgi:succinate dehydrogenase/fumarate reductase flavoprotein subunit